MHSNAGVDLALRIAVRVVRWPLSLSNLDLVYLVWSETFSHHVCRASSFIDTLRILCPVQLGKEYFFSYDEMRNFILNCTEGMV